MSNQKKRKKPLDFDWLSKPYEAVWARTPDEVPVWDASRGFPIDEPKLEVTESYVMDMVAVLNELIRRGIRDSISHVDFLGLILGDLSWRPLPPPTEGYPRLVRANYIVPVKTRVCNDTEVINAFVRLLRDEPKPPSLWVMKDIAELNAQVGPVDVYRENTLESWLIFAKHVKAHLKVRRSLELGGYEAMCKDVFQWHNERINNDKIPNHDRVMYSDFYCKLVIHAPSGEGTVGQTTFLKRLTDSLGGNVHTLTFYKSSFTSEGSYTSDIPLQQWVHRRLSAIWRPNAKILDCKGCGQPFYTTREGKSYCAPACRVLRRERYLAAKAKPT